MSVLNLPRECRFKQENTILVGLIPGPHEPSHDINTFLKPLVEDLLKFWNGVIVLKKSAVHCCVFHAIFQLVEKYVVFLDTMLI